MSADNYDGPIKHMVLLKWKPGTTEEQIKAFGEWNREMADDLGFGYNYENGPALNPRFHSAYFDYCIMLTFGGGYEAMQCFMSHWSHLRADERAQEVCSIIEDLMAFNFEATPYGRTEYDPALAREDIEREAKRTRRVHPDESKAFVPDLRGLMENEARETLAKFGLEAESSYIMGASWAPGRVNATEPAAQTEVEKGTTVKLTVSGDYLMGIDLPYVMENARPESPTGY